MITGFYRMNEYALEKTNKKALAVIIFSVFFTAGIIAQNIELPEVTTVISGDTEKAGADALPDFSDVLKIPSGSGGTEPVLPGVESSGKTEVAAPAQPKSEKSVYAEGLIGGGYPMLFTGNISVFRSAGDSPFKFSFEHESTLDYSKHSVDENYSDRTTKLEIDKSYKKNNFSWNLGGAYKSCADGLQGNVTSGSDKISLFNRDTYSVDGAVAYCFSNGFELGALADAEFYNRYAEKKCDIIPVVTYTELSPSLFMRWQGYGFNTGLTAVYSFSTELSDSLIFENGHRAEFTANLQWQNDFLCLYGTASAVAGNLINENSVIVPFTVGIDSSFPVYFANRRFSIQAEGGIKTYKSSIMELEEKYKFTKINWNPSETSDWYGKLSFTVPLKTAFTGTASVEYRKTAYGNGVWEPDYDKALDLIYSFDKKAHQLLITDFLLSYHYKDFSVYGQWRSNWMDLPALENNHLVKFNLDWQDEFARWGADVSVILPINSEIDTPILSTEGFVRLTSSVRAIISVNDIIKLYKGETRPYAGKYAARGGSATMLLKFFF